MEEKQVSFSHFIKNEIIEYEWSKEQLGILFFAFLRTNGTYKKSKYVFTTSLVEWEKKINGMFLEYYGLKIKPTRTKTLIKYEITDVDFLENFANKIGDLVVNSDEELKAYLAGSFVGKGWVSKPSTRFYHFEIRVRNLSHSLDIQEAMDALGIKTVTIQKNGWYYTYVKKAKEISKLIIAFNASQSMMIFEDARIERDFMATYKKMESIENYNLEKTIEKAKIQLACIELIKSKELEKFLSKNENEIMELRVENPNYSLSELQIAFNEINQLDISKSTINNWLNKIITLAQSKGGDK